MRFKSRVNYKARVNEILMAEIIKNSNIRMAYELAGILQKFLKLYDELTLPRKRYGNFPTGIDTQYRKSCHNTTI